MWRISRTFLTATYLCFWCLPCTNGVPINGTGTGSIVGLSPDGKPGNLSLTADVPDTYRTDITPKTGGKRIEKIEFLVDAVFDLTQLAVQAGWESEFERKTLTALETVTKLSSNKQAGNVGWQTKTAMWTIFQVTQYMQMTELFAEVGFGSVMDEQSPTIGYGQVLMKPRRPAGSTNQGPESSIYDLMSTWDNASQGNSSEQPETDAALKTFSRRGHSRRDTQPKIYCSDFHRRDPLRLNDYGIYTTIMSLLITQTRKAFESPQGLDTVVSKWIGAHNRDYDISVVFEPTSEKSETLTIRKAILGLADLASKLSNFHGPNRFRAVDFRLREENGNYIGTGAVVSGLPPVKPDGGLKLEGGEGIEIAINETVTIGSGEQGSDSTY